MFKKQTWTCEICGTFNLNKKVCRKCLTSKQDAQIIKAIEEPEVIEKDL